MALSTGYVQHVNDHLVGVTSIQRRYPTLVPDDLTKGGGTAAKERATRWFIDGRP